ncbi:bifunctional diguanylate cyclase/phosphodiesterase [Egbenema bharatensis]|uniref:bifunctional diguanylate cyclase/phosphodiesterase n=1 Tax=Egbenema bharatensis TaxID=3463334 RepID=UPI003A8B1F98
MKKISYREHLLHQITNRIRQSLELSEILNTAVEEIQAFLGVDRVKVYRFDADGCGEVIAESIATGNLPSLLNLRFPAADIPPQAREMFVKVRQRVIVDVATQRKTLQQLDAFDTGENLPVQDIRHAIVDPCHVRYLTTMGVMSSVVMPILHQRHLWGLLAIHHATSRLYTERELEIIQLLVDQLSIAIAQSNLLNQARQQAEFEAAINRVSHLLHCPMKLADIRQGVLESAVEALNGSGGRLYIMAEPTGEPAQLYTTGNQPRSPQIESHPVWQMLMCQCSLDSADRNCGNSPAVPNWQPYSRHLSERLFHEVYPGSRSQSCSIPGAYLISELRQTPAYATLSQEFEQTGIRSILLIPLQFHQQHVGYLSIFRDGYDIEIHWAGRQDKDTRNRMPRSSFELWRELKVDQAPEWTAEEMKLAQSIGLHLYMAIVQKRVEAMIRYQASHDGLTRLPNRLLFNEQLSLALVQAQQQDEMLGVAFLDLDRFKTINDSLGHAVGDQLLQQVASALRECLRDYDAIARWGGDEFTLLLPHLTSAEDITQLAQQILERLSLPFHTEQQELYVTASLGIALYPYDGEDVETLLKNADAAMYQAKQLGKNNYQLYTEEMNTKAVQLLSLEADLRRALSNQELTLHYQPQVNLQTGQMVGVEALLRWYHPKLGFVSPAEFIPLAEEMGLICTIGNWVLQTACEQHQAWCSMGLPPIRIAINLSAQQFQQPDLVNTIIQILNTTGVDPQYLEFELTESAAMRDVNFTIAVLKQLQSLGITIAIDDFGTGYSSLNAIKHFPLHILKIDRSFVQDAMQNQSDAAIAKTVVALGKGLGLNILAEGVETQEQLNFLRSIQCDSAQGYFFSKPLPATEIITFLRKSQKQSTRS